MSSIYTFRPSRERRRPVIDFMLPANEINDWGALDRYVRGVDSPVGVPDIGVSVVHAAATDWDFYSIPGVNGALSERAVELLSRFGTAGFEFVPMRLNGAPYFIPRAVERVDCLDIDRSEVTRFRVPPYRVWLINRCAFNLPRLGETSLFAIPEQVAELFVTEPLADAIRAAGLRGVQLEEIYRG